LYEERNLEHKVFGGGIVSQVKKMLKHQHILQEKTLPPMQVCFVKLVLMHNCDYNDQKLILFFLKINLKLLLTIKVSDGRNKI
jgi:hypothetical protein